ncbi:MAG: 2-hydroxychromene-2-carboxylate isomerase [Pseudomonadota bacterium]
MTRRIDYYFTLQSTWAFIGHAAFHDLAAKHGVEIAYKPCWLGAVFKKSGGLPLKERHPVRQAYRMVEMHRWRDKRGLDFDLEAAFFPFDPALADRMLIAVLERGDDPRPFIEAVFDALWRKGLNPADRDVLIALANDIDADGPALAEAAETDAIQAIYRSNTNAAIAGQVIGSPGYVLDGEVFWGQDRLDLLDDALSSGRAPYLMANADGEA